MNYYNEIKKELIDNELNKRVKDYCKNKYELEKYYNVGKLLVEAGKHYGEGILKNYSKRLTLDLNKRYSETSLKYFRMFYNFAICHSLSDELSYTHYKVLLSIKDKNKINYYINITKHKKLSVRELQLRIKNNEYERLPEETKVNLLNVKESKVKDLIKNPIIIKNNKNYEIISEKILQKLILEDMPSFLDELGDGFAFIRNEYKIKTGDKYNYIDLLLYNIKFKCYVVVELKITDLKKEYIGQIEIYMNYIDKNIKTIDEDKTIGIIIVKRNDQYIMEYCSDKRIISKTYELV